MKGKYKYAEGTSVRTHKVRLVNDCHLFPNSVSRATVRIQTDDIHPVVVQARKNGSLHLDGIIGVEGEDNPLLTGNSGIISRVEKDEDIQELKSKSGQLDCNKFRDISIVCLLDHMNDMFQRINEELSNDQLLRVYLLLISKDMVFSKGDSDLGTFTAVKHHIDTGNSRPIKQRMRRTPLWYANEEQEHLEKLLKAGVIEPSCSGWASPSVLVRK